MEIFQNFTATVPSHELHRREDPHKVISKKEHSISKLSFSDIFLGKNAKRNSVNSGMQIIEKDAESLLLLENNSNLEYIKWLQIGKDAKIYGFDRVIQFAVDLSSDNIKEMQPEIFDLEGGYLDHISQKKRFSWST